MIEGRIVKLDTATRRVVIATAQGQEIDVTFPEGALIEVPEPETMGTMGGELEDLHEGYWVEVEIASHNSDGSCNCATLVSVS